MNLFEAFKSAVSGQEDKAGIDMVDVYLANTKNAVDHSKEEKIAEFKEVMSVEIGSEEHEEYKWFLLSEVITKWDLIDDSIAGDIRQALADNSKNIESHIRYQMLRVMGYASDGLRPNDILDEKHLKKDALNFWLELLLVSYQNGNPDTITGHIIPLVKGKKPLLTCDALRDLLPEVRQAYGSNSEFQAQMEKIVHYMDSVTDQRNISNAVKKIVGGGFDVPAEWLIETAKKYAILVSPEPKPEPIAT